METSPLLSQQQNGRWTFNADALAEAVATSEGRRAIAETFPGFCLVYLSHYFTLAPADFHAALMAALADDTVEFLEVIGFRGSAKTVIASLALPLYYALVRPTVHPFIIIAADTGLQAGINIGNIKAELDGNELLKNDYGRMTFTAAEPADPKWTLESAEEWQAKNLLISNGVRILARSRGQKIRGLRHRQFRPSLVIIDDPEDLEWIRTKEKRDKTERWLKGEVLPAVDEVGRKVILVGNHLHNDALLARVERLGIFTVLKFPLINADGRCTWPAKYPDDAALARQRVLVGEVAWMREYLLKVVPDEGQEVLESDITYYDALPPEAEAGLRGNGVDLAISKKETADCTSIVSGRSCFINAAPRIYILPRPVNARLDFRETIESVKAASMLGLALNFVEDVAYQKAAIEELIRAGIAVVRMHPMADKRARLRVAATYIKNGTVQFPRTGCEDLLMQLLGFGIEEHDDLVDALVYLIIGLVQNGIGMPEVVRIA